MALHVSAIRKPPRKVVVVDLDDTVWGGVVGEVGIAGLALGEDGIGRAFQDFQRELLKLTDTGVLLAACSKNNPEDAWSALERHPGMVLERKHLVALRINWQDKATNLGELAKELNLGIDSFVFLDDNPVERELVRQMLPEVLVPELPEDPALRPAFVRAAPWFNRLRVTSEDRQRGESYRVQKLGTELRDASTTFEGFLTSLAQEVAIEAVSEASIGRAVQLCQRTNQFNLTTPRYTLVDVEQFLRNAAVEVNTLSVRDRFGDHGITGLTIVRYAEDRAEIDTLLLSCRVLGRRIENVLLSHLASRARDRGARLLVGKYIATPKNGQVSTFFADHGFTARGNEEFALDLTTTQLPLPAEIKLIAPQYGATYKSVMSDVLGVPAMRSPTMRRPKPWRNGIAQASGADDGDRGGVQHADQHRHDARIEFDPCHREVPRRAPEMTSSAPGVTPAANPVTGRNLKIDWWPTDEIQDLQGAIDEHCARARTGT